MTQFVGMDVGAVRAASGQLRSQADAIDAVARAVDVLIGQLSAAWHGSDAAAFQGWWQQQHRPALVAAAAAVAGLAQSATFNAQQQSGASDTLAGPTLSASRGTTLAASQAKRIWHDAQGTDGALHVVSVAAHTTHSGPALKYLHDLDDTPVSGVAGGIFAVAGAIGVGTSSYEAGQDLANQQYRSSALAASDAVATALKTSDDPVTYLAGVNVSIWSQVVSQATLIDWHQGIPNPLTGDNLTQVYAPTLGDAAKQVLHEIPGFL